jgi:hypothetical protein
MIGLPLQIAPARLRHGQAGLSHRICEPHKANLCLGETNPHCLPSLPKAFQQRSTMATPTSPIPNDDGPEATVSLHETQHTPLIRSENKRQPGNATGGSVRVVVQRPHKRSFLLPLILMASATGGDVMKELREIRNHEVSRIKVLKPVRQLLWTTVIEIATLSTVSDLIAL